MTIIIALFSLVAVSAGSFLSRSNESATSAMIVQLQGYLDEYYRIAGEYPADGLDSPVANDEGTPIRGAACLHYFLTKRLVVEEIQGGVSFPREYEPIASFRESELSEADPDRPGAREILDGWKEPLHYDNTENGVFAPQGGDVHSPPWSGFHPQDPRESTYRPAAPRPGAAQSRSYDIWSHSGIEENGETREPVASWLSS
jgi:hypothetical protein